MLVKPQEAIAAQLVSVKEVRDLILDYAIGSKWGYPKGQDAISIISSIFSGFGAFMAAITSWAVIAFAGLYLRVIGEFATASFLFTLTWTIGQATNQFYLSGRQLNAAALRQAFMQAQKEGKILSKTIDLTSKK